MPKHVTTRLTVSEVRRLSLEADSPFFKRKNMQHHGDTVRSFTTTLWEGKLVLHRRDLSKPCLYYVMDTGRLTPVDWNKRKTCLEFLRAL